MMNRGVTSANRTTRQPTIVPPQRGSLVQVVVVRSTGIPAVAERQDDEASRRDHGEREPLDRVAEVWTVGQLGQRRGLGEPIGLCGVLLLEQEVARRDGVGVPRLDRLE